MTDESPGPPAEHEQVMSEPSVEDDDLEPPAPEVTEPLTAMRSSPYAIAAFVVSVVAFMQLPYAGALFGGDWIRNVLTMGPAAGAAGLALWLSGRAEEEVYVSEGRIGGVGLYRAAMVLSIVTLAWSALNLILVVLQMEPFGFNFDV